MSDSELTERVVELEIRSAQQQDLLEQLNSALVGQQRTLETFRREIERLRTKVEELSEPGQVDGGATEKPPHY